MWLALIECYGLIKYTAILRSNKKYTRIFIYIFRICLLFKYFTSAKFYIYPCDVTSSCVTNLHTNLPYLGLAKIIVAHDWTRSFYSLKMPVNLYQFRGTVGLFSSKSTVNRSNKSNGFITSSYKKYTNVECSLISIHKIFLFLSLFSVLSFLKVSECPLKQNKNMLQNKKCCYIHIFITSF